MKTFTNRLSKERSPYLLQHAHNPVDWYPWGEEAFARAKAYNLPIFLSIGYSTCHWCHVMERESFSDETIAQIMNENFVNIKVDREERPDVDEQYMTYVRMRTGGGGWPLSVFLTDDRKPFFGGTYSPPQDRNGIPGFSRILELISKEWKENREKIVNSSIQVTEAINRAMRDIDTASSPSPIGPEEKRQRINNTIDYLTQIYDEQLKGFGKQSKFPTPINLLFLFRLSQFLIATRAVDTLANDMKMQAEKMLYETLDAMDKGGIHDVIMGGFHRYTIDRHWKIPHFEKMLYDQAQLLQVYAQANPERYKTTIEGIERYLESSLRGPDGGYFCAEDADSLSEINAMEKEEGAFVTWTEEQLQAVLDDHEYKVFTSIFKGPILHRIRSLESACSKLALDIETCNMILNSALKKLVQARKERPPPHRDEKILTEWNALLISGYCQAGNVQKARECADYLQKNHWKDGKLWRTLGQTAFAGDYSFLISALLTLHSSSLEDQWLIWAKELQNIFDKEYWDEYGGGYLTAPKGSADVIFQLKDWNDGAIPSSNATAAHNLLRLFYLTGEQMYRDRYDHLVKTSLAITESGLNSSVMPAMMIAFLADLYGSTKIALHPQVELPLVLLLNVQFPFSVITVEPELDSADHIQACRGTICLPLIKYENKGNPMELVERIKAALSQ